VAGIVFAVIGVVALLDSLDVWNVRPFRLWPILLIAIGVVVIAGVRPSDDEDA
jgi:hypothetical protein